MAAHDFYPDDLIATILRSTRTIAMIGASANPARPSYRVMHFLLEKGYRVLPVNPGYAGTTIGGVPVHARLSDTTEPIDMVDIFRRSEFAGDAVDQALALVPLPKVVWMQLGIRDDAAAARAEAAGITVIMNRCLKIEYSRLIA